MNNLKHSRGSILLETLISIVLIGLIVVGSFYSYGFVYQRIRSQRQQRKALGVLQGWMEQAISYILQNPNDLSNSDIEENIRVRLDRNFYSDPYDISFNPNDATIDLRPNNGNMAKIRIWITLDNSDNLSIPLYTEIYLIRRIGY